MSLQENQQTQDLMTGAMRDNWVEIAQLWAGIEPLSAREFIAAQAQQSQVSARITLRYRAGINSGMRLVYRNAIYSIEGVLADKESGVEYMTLPCSEGVSDG